MVDFQPAGYHAVTPYLSVAGAPDFIDFVVATFDGVETQRMTGPDGAIAHAEVRIGDSALMLTEHCDYLPAYPAALYLYVEDVDASYAKALSAGATSQEEPNDKFYGDRTAGVVDGWGNHWYLGTHIEDVSAEEVDRRAAALAAG